jgi:hypothetical protein
MTLDPATIALTLLATLGIMLPGAAVLAWQADRRRSGMENVALAFGLGIAAIAILALLGRIAGFAFTAPALIAVELCAVAALAVGLIRRRPRLRFSPFLLAELAALAALTGLRFYQARSLALPAWVDSVHHTFLVRLFLEGGGIPADLQPWIPGPFYYHYGFHAATAVFAALAGFSADRAVLIFGQILNAGAALAAYRLALAIRPNRKPALLALALTGFAAQMPAYYLAWGRYTLLAGVILLALAAAEAVEFAFRAPRRGAAVRLAVLTAGLLLTHYLAALLLAVFLLVVGGYLLLEKSRRRRFGGLAAAAGAGTAIALPWLVPMLRHSTVGVGVDVIASQAAADAMYFANYAEYVAKLLGPARNYVFLAAGLLAALAALFRRGPARILAVWGLILAVQTLPWGLRIEPFRPDHLAIVLFLPAAVLAALGAGRLAGFLRRRLPAAYPRLFLAGAALGFCLAGIWQTRDIVPAGTVFADADDRAAVEWVSAFTPAGAVFLINTAPWQGGLYRGVDGGWWLTALAGRRALLPPMLYSFADRNYIGDVNRLASEISTMKGCSDGFRELISQYGVTYIYVKDGTGSLRAEDLDGCAGVNEVFRAGKVRIYAVVAAAGSGILPETTAIPIP